MAGMTGARPALLLVPLLAPLLTSCGYKAAATRLQPPDPSLTRAEQQQARRAERAMVEAGLTVPAAARPQRVDDLTVTLGIREDNPFLLPPAGTAGDLPPFPGEPQAEGDRAGGEGR